MGSGGLGRAKGRRAKGGLLLPLHLCHTLSWRDGFVTGGSPLVQLAQCEVYHTPRRPSPSSAVGLWGLPAAIWSFVSSVLITVVVLVVLYSPEEKGTMAPSPARSIPVTG